ncbi:MFS transporter [Luedemannella flava]|uniref:MFS transporter n=1 Tax=Luedemannella flava TaxID=349316 RepID=A0ABP4YMD3_9ACTN
MTGAIAQARTFSRPTKVLLINQFTINIGFYMLMPYLAGHLSYTVGLATWAVGLVLGVRNVAQQGMFLVGGSVADRFGYRPAIIAGLALRVVGFTLLGLVTSLPALILGAALTGLAGALFNPAVRAYVAAEAGDRQTEAFAVFNVFYQAGILLGPLVGLALMTVNFGAVCLVAAATFAVLMLVQLGVLPARTAPAAGPAGVLAGWRTVVGNRSFVLFSVAMTGSYLLNYQVYLALPIQVRQVTGSERWAAALFVVSGALTVLGQVRVTTWIRRRWTAPGALIAGVLLMTGAFLPPLLAAGRPPDITGPLATAIALGPAVASCALLALATMIVYPFEMATIVSLARDQLVATHYGFYNTVSGIGIAAGNLLVGAAYDLATRNGWPAVPWLMLCMTGLASAVALYGLWRHGHLGRAPSERDVVAV